MKTPRLICLIVLLCVWQPIAILAQMELFPCENGNEQLKLLTKGQTIESLYVHDCYGEGMDEMATSFLKPSGRPPRKAQDPDDPTWGRYESWTCRYNPGNIADKNPKTAWVEGIKGYGIGELVLIPCLDLQKPVKIWNGYGKSPKLFTANGRVKTAKIYVIQAEIKDVTQYGTIYEKITTIAQSTVSLKDKNSFQPLSIPAFEKKQYFNKLREANEDYKYLLGIEILEVYKGSKYEDTCICEISN